MARKHNKKVHIPTRLLLDSRVVVLPIAYHPNFVMLSSLNP